MAPSTPTGAAPVASGISAMGPATPAATAMDTGSPQPSPDDGAPADELPVTEAAPSSGTAQGAEQAPEPASEATPPQQEPVAVEMPTTEPTEQESADEEPLQSDPALLDALGEYLEQPSDQRGPIDEQSYAEQALSRADAEAAADLLWQAKAESVRQERAAEHEDRSITIGEFTLRYDFTVFGDEPAEGHSLFLSLHGGGNAEPSVNDEQWENQKVLYQPDEGIYLSPRAPTDTWNLWHQDHIDPLFERLITNFIVMENVNPNRIYVMGYSAGGDGVYQLGPRMADHWAAASAMAGHPNEAQPLSLRNIGFTIHVGELDTAYDRNLIAQEWDDQLNQLQQSDPEGYVHVVEVHPGKPHWMDLEDAVAVPWMAEFTRNPTPSTVVWYQDDVTHDRFYWLSVEQPQAETTVRATVEGQTIDISSDDLSGVIVRLSDDVVDMDQPVVVVANGVEVYSGPVARTIATLSRTLDEREDPAMVFSGEVAVDF